MTTGKIIDPAKFGLPAKTILQEGGPGRLVLVIARKSRLIMADGHKIVAKFEQIRKTSPGIVLDLRTTAPICTKTRVFLEENGIGVK